MAIGWKSVPLFTSAYPNQIQADSDSNRFVFVDGRDNNIVRRVAIDSEGVIDASEVGILSPTAPPLLIDIKTSNYLYPYFWLQLSAYHQLLLEHDSNIKIEGVGVLWLNAKTRTVGKNGAIQGIGWQLVTKDMDELKADWELFQSTYKLWNALNKDTKPKQLSYQLTHKRNG